MLTPMKSLGEFIRDRRDELDLSLREFARQVGCSAPFASDVERGRRFPSDSMLEDMARVLQTDVEELRALDPRPPLEEIRRLSERDPQYAFAFRTIVDKGISAKEIADFAKKKRRRKK